jgi:glycosyltransferase involved in cell wall biosynthesis
MIIAFENLFGRQYEGGANWLEVTLLSLGALVEPPTCLLLGATEDELPESLRGAGHVRPVPLVRPNVSRVKNLANRAIHRALSRPWEDAALTRVAREHGVNLWVGFSGFEGLGTHRSLLVWHPDFQSRHLPELFPAEEIRNRERQWDHVARRADGIVVISRAVADDALKSHPQIEEKLHVCGFPPVIAESLLARDPEGVRLKYNLPRQFLLVCNQFWQHKNHALVLNALSRLKRCGKFTPVVAFTGRPHDYRKPDSFSQLLRFVHEEGLHDRCRVLGVLPRDEQLALVRAAEAVIQPSLFEGRGAIAEEATLLGTQILLSDLPVHRELDVPGAIFFPADGVGELAELMGRSYARTPRSSAEVASESARSACDYGERFLAVCARTVEAWKAKGEKR